MIGRRHSAATEAWGKASPELSWKDYLCISITIFPLEILYHSLAFLQEVVHSKTSLAFPPCGLQLPAGEPLLRAGEGGVSRVWDTDLETWHHGFWERTRPVHLSRKEPDIGLQKCYHGSSFNWSICKGWQKYEFDSMNTFLGNFSMF